MDDSATSVYSRKPKLPIITDGFQTTNNCALHPLNSLCPTSVLSMLWPAAAFPLVLLLSFRSGRQAAILPDTVTLWAKNYVETLKGCFELIDWNMVCRAHREDNAGLPCCITYQFKCGSFNSIFKNYFLWFTLTKTKTIKIPVQGRRGLPGLATGRK